MELDLLKQDYNRSRKPFPNFYYQKYIPVEAAETGLRGPTGPHTRRKC